LIEFIQETKPEFINYFVAQIQEENKSKLEDMAKILKQTELIKIEAESKSRELKDITEENSNKINNLNSEIEKKKREIIDLSERIRQVEQDIRQRREQTGTNIRQSGGNPPF
jgi:hypothetical protein